MTRTTRTVVVVCVATTTAAIASFGVYAAVKSIPVREVEVAQTLVAVAAANLPTGSRVTEKDVKLVAWPSSSPVPGAFSRIDPIVNRGLMASVVENEPLTDKKLAPIEAGAGLPPTIPPGMRAMSVKVDEVIAVAGFVVPGTRVDVVVTVRRGAASGEPMSRTVLSNVLVLAAGTRYDQEQAKDGKPQKSSVVTVAVAPADAERMALASSEGKISLALRNPLDVAPTDTPGIRVTALMKETVPPPGRTSGTPRPQPVRREPAAVVAAKAEPALYTVEAIRAAKRSEEVVR
jgi:pilus assembly protein CpaB